MIVVIAILGILAAIAIPRLGGFRQSADDQAMISNARTVVTAVDMYRAQYGSETKPLYADLSAYVTDLTGYEVLYDANTVEGISITVDSTTTKYWIPGTKTLTTTAP